MESYIGIDVGTQALKAVLIDTVGEIQWSRSVPYATRSPQRGWFEQDPRDWLHAYDQILEQLDQERPELNVRGIGFTGQMHTTVVADDEGKPLRPAILWSDGRASHYGEALIERYGKETLRRITGNYPLPNFSLLKLLWIRDHEPEIYQRVKKTAVAKDWLRNVVSDTHQAEVTDASGTFLLDVGRRQWASPFMQDVGIDPSWWGQVVESTGIVGELKRGPKGFGGIPVVAGAGDQEASAIGTGLQNEEDLGLSLGTSGVLFWPTTEFHPSPHRSVHAFCHAAPNTWHWMAVTQSAALSLSWLRQAFFSGKPYTEIERAAANASPGARGLFFFPFLQGERAPLVNPLAQGTLMGLTPEHTSSEVARAVLEGVAFSLYHAWTAMNATGAIKPRRIVATGGGSKSTLWLDILAGVFGYPLVVGSDQGAARGAALLARDSVVGKQQDLLKPAFHARESDKAFDYRELTQRYIWWAERLNGLWADTRD